MLEALPASARLRVLTRPYEAMDDNFVPHAQEAHRAVLARGSSEVRTLRTLHAKIMVIDEEVAYCGSANWYRYSLETSREVVLRGPADDASGLLDLAEGLWQEGTGLGEEPRPPAGRQETKPSGVGAGFREEALDPIAAKVLKEVKGAFVVSKKGK